MEHRKKDQWKKYGLVAPSVMILLLVTLFPFLYTLNISFHHVIGRNIRQEWPWVGFDNFGQVLTDSIMWESAIRTLEFIVIVITIELILGFALALLFSQNTKYHRLLRTLLLTPMVVTPVVVGLMWKALLKLDGGMVNKTLELIGLPPQPWLTSKPIPIFEKIPFIGDYLIKNLNSQYSFLSLIIIDVWQWTPFVMLILLSGILSIPREIIEASEVDGANKWQLLTNIILPLLKRIIIVTILLRTIDALKVFDTVYALYGSAADQRLLNVHIMNIALRIRNYGQGAAISILVLIVVLNLSQWFVKMVSKENNHPY